MEFIAFSEVPEDPLVIAQPGSVCAGDQPPWLACSKAPAVKTAPLVQLHNEIVAFCNFISPTPGELAVRQRLISELQEIILEVFPESTVQVFGSQLTNILTPSSDVDIVVLNAPGMGTEPLYVMEAAILKRGIAKYVEVIASARVPIIKMDHAASGISVDILCNNFSGVETGKLMKKFVREYPPLRPLTILLKYFLTQRKLNETYSGGVGSFVLCSMVISFLQMRQRSMIARRVEEKHVTFNLGSLLLEFLNLYGNTFNYVDVGITVLGGGTYFPKQSKEGDWINPTRPLLLAVENPETPGMDMGRNSYLLPRVKKAFEHAHRVLLYALTARRAEHFSFLAFVINTEDPLLLSRIMLFPVVRADRASVDVTVSSHSTDREAEKCKKRGIRNSEKYNGNDDPAFSDNVDLGVDDAPSRHSGPLAKKKPKHH